jgi:hypothetical protein
MASREEEFMEMAANAATIKNFFDSLVAVGFTEDQAISLITKIVINTPTVDDGGDDTA